MDLTKIHYLTGPFEIKGAEPGDLLVVNITDVQPFEHSPWGFTGIFDRKNGGGFLDEHYPKAAKAIWDFDGIYCTSRHIPGVRFAGLIHPGILGCAPSHEVLAEWNRREADLISACVHSHPEKVVAQPPLEVNAHAGQATGDIKAKIAREGARTIPGRPEHGGNGMSLSKQYVWRILTNLTSGHQQYLERIDDISSGTRPRRKILSR